MNRSTKSHELDLIPKVTCECYLDYSFGEVTKMRCSSERGDSEPRPDRVSPLPVPPWDSSPLPVPVIVNYSNRKTAKANIVHFVVAVSQLYFKQISWFLV